MTAVAALTFGGLMTSCTHDIDGSGSSGDVAKNAQESYEQAFLNTFGRPVDGFDWGFGNSTAASRAMTRAKGDYDKSKGSMQPVVWGQDPSDGQWKWVTYTFPSAPTIPTAKPTNATYYSGNSELKLNGETYWMDENTDGSYIDVKTHGDFYIVKSGNGEENVTIAPPSWYVGNVDNGYKIRVFVCPGVTFKIPTSGAGNLQANVEYYFAPGANLICDASIKLNGTCFYVAGNTTAPQLEVNNTGIFYNMGIANISGPVTVENGKSIIVNDGTLNATSLQTKGSGHVQNNAEITISDYTIINSNYNIWVNNGHYKTKYFAYTATSSSVINNCYLEVEENFMMNIADGSGDFKIDAGGGVKTKNFYGGGPFTAKDNQNNNTDFTSGPFKITMGSKSVFKVTEDCYLNATASGIADNGYGFSGVGNDYAVLEAKDVKNSGNPGHGYVAYSGNMYVSAESHFAQGTAGASNGASYIIFKDGCSQKNIYAPGFENGKPNIKINVTPCNPGFNGDTTPPDNPVTPVTDKVRVIAEDLSTLDGKADFDFNDIVFDVELLSSGMVKITLQAAGGTLPLTVGDPTTELQSPTMEMQKDSQGNDMEEVMKYEVHRLFKVATTTMVNTNAAGGANRDAVSFEIANPSSSNDVKEIANAIPIRVYKGGQWIELAKAVPVTGIATITASKLAVDGTFGWCAERQPLENDSRYQYTDNAGNNLGSRFRMYLQGELEGKWWLSTTEAIR